ncbi:autotransporter outer membrane beta-barrel domain-containing protein [Simkania negevensis]|uniref:Autotransporter outer membrane beta-barrel domain-containing protein n=1 Tax=Simkania negevensis TaxID=83561 RepID=A0ABS3AR29_9BACT|nr:autotransporter outer membrane beta-barrel domain-containing protein [Simkania negevensis]
MTKNRLVSCIIACAAFMGFSPIWAQQSAEPAKALAEHLYLYPGISHMSVKNAFVSATTSPVNIKGDGDMITGGYRYDARDELYYSVDLSYYQNRLRAPSNIDVRGRGAGMRGALGYSFVFGTPFTLTPMISLGYSHDTFKFRGDTPGTRLSFHIPYAGLGARLHWLPRENFDLALLLFADVDFDASVKVQESTTKTQGRRGMKRTVAYSFRIPFTFHHKLGEKELLDFGVAFEGAYAKRKIKELTDIGDIEGKHRLQSIGVTLNIGYTF